MLTNTLLLFAVPIGYWVAALFLVIAIILFIISIFMKDSGAYYNEDDYERESYEREQYNKRIYEREIARKRNSGNDRNVNPVFDESEFDGYDDDDNYGRDYGKTENNQRYSKETEELKGLIADATGDMGETKAFTPVKDDEDKNTRVLTQNKDKSWKSKGKEVPAFDEEFSEEFDAEEDDDTDDNQGMSFADEVKKLIEEEERKKHNR